MTEPLPAAGMHVAVDRDSVCAGDDAEGHAITVFLPGPCTVAELLAQVCQCLPRIAGGQATWLVDVPGAGGRCIGVVAQQWAAPRLRVPGDMSVGELFGDGVAGLFLRYLGQVDPEGPWAGLAPGGAA